MTFIFIYVLHFYFLESWREAVRILPKKVQVRVVHYSTLLTLVPLTINCRQTYVNEQFNRIYI
jgi:hypothetical protein